MSRDLSIQLSLLGWFVLLAIAEAAFARTDSASSNHNGRLVTNFGLTALVILAAGLMPLARMSSSLFGERLGIGLANTIALPWIAIFALLLLFDSIGSYWVHRLMHAAPLLWRVHRVHHADSGVDVSTSLRNHPFELLVTVPVSALAVLLVGAPVSVVVAAQTIFVAAAIWQHADIRLPLWLDRPLARLIVTPRLHRLHHSRERQVHDSNFGDSIVLWDWLFGTLNLAEERQPVGLEGEAARADRLLDQIWSPLRTA